MQELDLGSKKYVNVKFNGESYKLRFPTILEAKDLTSKFSESSESDQLDLTISLIESLGLPKDIINQLDIDQLTSLVNCLMPSKKK